MLRQMDGLWLIGAQIGSRAIMGRGFVFSCAFFFCFSGVEREWRKLMILCGSCSLRAIRRTLLVTLTVRLGSQIGNSVGIALESAWIRTYKGLVL